MAPAVTKDSDEFDVDEFGDDAAVDDTHNRSMSFLEISETSGGSGSGNGNSNYGMSMGMSHHLNASHSERTGSGTGSGTGTGEGGDGMLQNAERGMYCLNLNLKKKRN